MTERQALALSNPCARAREALRSEFQRSMRVGSQTLSTILTVPRLPYARVVTVGNVLFRLGYGTLGEAEDLALGALNAVTREASVLDYAHRCLEAAVRLERRELP